MQAHALLHVQQQRVRDGSPRSHIRRLRSEGALVLRPTRERLPAWTTAMGWGQGPGNAVTVRLTAGAAGPLGGDQWRLDVEVGSGVTLMLGAVAATIALPGPHGAESHSRINISVADGGTLIWSPGTLIAAEGCRHASTNLITLGQDARLYLREETIFGRQGELPGDFRQRLRVVRDGTTLYDQELAVGPGAPGWRASAVTGGHRALGSILVVDPRLENHSGFGTAVSGADPDTAIMALSDSATLTTAVAADRLELRKRLDAAFHVHQDRPDHGQSDPPTTAEQEFLK